MSVAYVDSVKVVSVHNRALQKFNLSEMTLEQSLQFQVRFFPITNTASSKHKQRNLTNDTLNV